MRESDYEKRLKAAYPIHPEIFDRLYTDWSTLVKFQRTRGVLRLMASVIHSLWEKGDRNPLILPSNIPIDDPRVQFELTRYLSDNWVPVIEKDVDGPNALPLRLDSDVPNLGKYAAGRRVARTIYLGSAPTATGPRAPKRFHGSVNVDPTRVGRDAGRIADEVISHLVGLMGSDVKVTLEIEAEIPTGAPDSVVRTVTENSRTLKFTSQGFEEE